MKEEFVSYQQAKALKECGFDWKCDHHYDFVIDSKPILQSTKRNSDQMEHCVAVPSLSMAQKWLRDVKGWGVTSIPTLAEYGVKKYRWDICHWSNPEYGDSSNGIFDTYESALSAGLDKALKLIIEKQ